ncbi:hypothetical protein Tco_0895274 [Tanacetum coccineum]|uniref:Uncharacterized protein n=1 Tax=Tanacetum coccineum TaxID=301880 RepID=A0ABQ5CH08_9ASTR
MLASDYFNQEMGELQHKSMILGRVHGLDEVYGLGDSSKLKDITDYDPDADTIFDNVTEAFYKLEFPYISLLVEKAGKSVKEFSVVEPPACQGSASTPL